MLKQLLSESGLTLAVAESLTGGLLASRITSVSGASAYFKGGLVAYTIESKVELLGVDGQKAAECNCVSPLVAVQMAEGVRKLFGADIGVATTGYAESYPRDDGTLGTPIAYIAVSLPYDRIETGFIAIDMPLTRQQMQERVAETALELMLEELAGLTSPSQLAYISGAGI